MKPAEDSSLTDGMAATIAELGAIMSKIETAKEQLRAKQPSNEQLIEWCAAAIVAGERHAADLKELRSHVGGLSGGDQLLAHLALHAQAGADLTRLLASAGISGWADSRALERLTAIVAHTESATKSAGGRKAAASRHAKAEVSEIKQLVHSAWLRWKSGEGRSHASTAAFARFMLDKYYEQLTSTQVVEKWCRAWARATATE